MVIRILPFPGGLKQTLLMGIRYSTAHSCKCRPVQLFTQPIGLKDCLHCHFLSTMEQTHAKQEKPELQNHESKVRGGGISYVQNHGSTACNSLWNWTRRCSLTRMFYDDMHILIQGKCGSVISFKLCAANCCTMTGVQLPGTSSAVFISMFLPDLCWHKH
jgi:hypothetical protein